MVPETPDSTSPSYWKIIDRVGSVGGIGGLLLTIILHIFSLPLSVLIFVGGLSLGVLLLGMVAHVMVSNGQPLESASLFQGHAIPWPKREEQLTKPLRDIPSTKEDYPVSTEDLLRAIKKTHDLVELKPNLVHSTGEVMKAHGGEHTAIIQGAKPEAPNFGVLTLRYHNSPAIPRARIAAVEAVYGEIAYSFFDGSYPKTIHHGAWLSEQDNKVDIGITVQRNLIVAFIDEDKEIYAVEREFEGAHPQGVTRRVFKLSADVTKVRARLLKASDGSTVDNWEMILEIVREPDLKLRLTNAFMWKSEYVHGFIDEGLAFSTKLHDIWKDAHAQVPFDDTPSPSLATMLTSNSANAPERITFFDTLKRIAAIEREQEEKLIEEIKDWESRAAEFIGVYISADQRDKFLQCQPSTDNGFNRVQKSPFHRLGLPEGKVTRNDWTLSDAVSSRTNKLIQILKE